MARKPRRRRTTIKDVAAQVGVSAMTVSRVINGGVGVQDRTRVVVEDAIRALGYVHNATVRSLSSALEPKIGVIYANSDAAFIRDLLLGLFERSEAHGIRPVLVRGVDRKAPDKAALNALVASGVAGFVVLPPLGDCASVMDYLGETGLPTAAIGAYAVETAICVRIDDRRAAFDMTEHLIRQGHRRLGFIAGDPDQVASAERLAGFYAAARKAGDVQVAIAQGDFSFDSGLRAANQLLDPASSPSPSAIFASNDEMAAAAIWVAHSRSLEVPGDLSIVGFDDTAAGAMIWPPLTTVSQPRRELAAEALRLLAAEIDAPGSHQGADHVLEHGIVERRSIARMPPQLRAASTTRRE